MKNNTLGIIKPDAVEKNLIGSILSMVEQSGLRIVHLQMLQLSRERAQSFYKIHQGKPFFDGLIDYMTSGKIVVFAMESDSDDVVKDFRTLIGATDPAEAAEGTVRSRFGESKARNAVHGSDSPENAAIEIQFFFGR